MLAAGTIETLKKRKDFLHLKSGARIREHGFLLAAKMRKTATHVPDNVARIGFTITKKCGTAVIRNRIKRRFREAVRLGLQEYLKAGHDYNIIGYKSSLEIAFPHLIIGLQSAAEKYINHIHKTESRAKIKVNKDET